MLYHAANKTREEIKTGTLFRIHIRKGMSAAQILEAKGGIENKLHRVLDMQFWEYESRAQPNGNRIRTA